ncbi:hypothetical protein AMATHDRAFT_2904 [Amanita thiersii Skay4041]|uniref:C2H2-type domain-containing protein n=1 Tax=Amanita thiersii Skay4041 TaxID=703135 RepID=A0A2A9NNE9_9AGAR|nr:hypothetical protein AMATHDRAFT_2904 [Amanita thiersii Skay4041]
MALTLPIEEVARLQVSFKVSLPEGKLTFEMSPNASVDVTDSSMASLRGLKLHFQGAHDSSGLSLNVWASCQQEGSSNPPPLFVTGDGPPFRNTTQVQSPFSSVDNHSQKRHVEAVGEELTGRILSAPLSVPTPSYPLGFECQSPANPLLNGTCNDMAWEENEQFAYINSLDIYSAQCSGGGAGTSAAFNSPKAESGFVTDSSSTDTCTSTSPCSTSYTSSPKFWHPPFTSPLCHTASSPSQDGCGTLETSSLLSSADTEMARYTAESLDNQIATISRPYPCLMANCDRWFKRDYTRRVHMLTHLRVRERQPFACTVPDCYERFSRKHDRLRHEVGRHGVEGQWKCSSCNRFFSSNVTMERHFQDKHGKGHGILRPGGK